MQLDRAYHFISGRFYLAHPLGVNVGYQWAFLDVISQNCLAGRLVDAGVDVGEKDHPVNSLDVLGDGRVVERLAGLRVEVNTDGVLFDALVTDNADPGDCRRGGR